MFGFLKSALFWIIVALLGAGTYLFFQGNSFADNNSSAQVVAPAQVAIPAIQATLVQVHEESEQRRILECGVSGCIPKNPPESVGGSPLSDGTAWYRYAERTEKQGVASTVLERVDNEGNATIITEENLLVKPREMMISTDGTKIAYFLDNIHDDSDLTELWVYDSKEGGAKVVAEKLFRKDVASRVRWNASSRVVWFLQDGDKKEFVVSALGGSGAAPRFTGIDWQEHARAADTGVMDVNDDASLIAFAEPMDGGFSRLVVARGNESSVQKPVKGNVVFVRWMEHNELLYAVQDGTNLSFWMGNEKKEWPITRMKAVFESAHSPGSSALAAFVAKPREQESRLYVLQIATGLIKDVTIIPPFSGKTYVVQTSEAKEASSQAVAGITSAHDDGTIVAFIEQNIQAITQDRNVKASRLLITDVPNTLFVDFTGSAGSEQRILVSVMDVVHPEWKVVAKYTTINGIWKRSDTTGDKEPNAKRLYEWEDSLSKWILKQTY